MTVWSEFQRKRLLEIAMELQRKHAGNPKAYWREFSKSILAQCSDDRERMEMEGLLRTMKTLALLDIP
jgi:hypothetical protein